MARRSVDSAHSGKYVVAAFSIVPQAEDKVVQQRLIENGMPPSHNPLRFTNSFFAQGEFIRDDYNASCLGWANVIEVCAVVIDCIDVSAPGPWWIHTPVAATYHVEAVETDPNVLDCIPSSELRPLHHVPVTEAQTFLKYVTYAATLPVKTVPPFTFPLHFAGRAAEWWATLHDLKPTSHWMAMVTAIIGEAARQPENSDALWLEFGVGSGKTTIRIVTLMAHFGITAVLHGFDSFEGIPEQWNNLDVHAFTMRGEAPDFLIDNKNVVLHKGWFNETLRDLRQITPTRVAFLHIDVDLYSSCRDVLEELKCRLERGTIILFDELFNYPDWEQDGEFRCLEEFCTRYGLQVEYLGLFFGQSVPLVVSQPVDDDFCSSV